MKRLLSLLLVLAMSVCMLSMFSVVSQAAMIDTEYGFMQDTSDPSNGIVYWAFKYNRYKGTATLTLTGDGYMPNYILTDSWLPFQATVQCYITEVIVQDGVKSIMENAFAGEIKLQKVVLSDTVEYIGDGAFANTDLSTINIPSGVKKLSANAFAESPIRSYSVSSDNPYYKSYNGAVYSKDMKKLVVAPAGKWETDPDYQFAFPETVTEISEYAFAYSGVKSITIPSNVKEIKKFAFYDTALETVKFQKGIQYIYDGAFIDCPDIKEFHIPSTLKYMGRFALGYNYGIDYESAEMLLDDAGVSYTQLNEDNIDSYLNKIGYSVDSFLYPEINKNVTVYAPSGSAAQEYAKENGLIFVRSQALTPDLVSVVSGIGGMTVTWTRSDDAVGYYVYRKNLNNVWQRIAIVRGADNTSYFDSGAYAGKKNTYTVRAYNALGQSYCYQSGVSGVYIPYVKLKSVGNNVGGVRINWEKQSGVEYYSIYRRAEGQSAFHYIGKASKNATTYLDTTVTSNKRYVYTVKGTVGGVSGAYDTNGLAVIYVEAPDVTVYNITNGIAVKWTGDYYAENYRIYRKTNGGSWQLVKIADTDDRVYYDPSVKRGELYTYTVRAVYNGTYSCYYPEGKTLVSVNAPMNITLQNRVSGVMVNWNKCDGAKGYYIYRKGSTGGFKYIGKVTSQSTLNYLDMTAKAGETYTYTVRAYNGTSLSTYNLNGVSIDYVYTPRLSSAVSTAKGITISYTASDGCDGYYIYRRTEDSSWLRIATVKGERNISYTDANAVKGTTYIYTVKAYNGSVMSSYFANGIKIKDIY